MAPGFDVKNSTKRCSPGRPRFNNFSRNGPEIEQKIDWFFGPESIGKSITPVIIKMSAVATPVELAVPSAEVKVKKPRGPRKKDVAEPAPAPAEGADAEAEPKAKKPRAPVLPAKYSKFVQFAFYLVNKLNDDAAIAGSAPVIDANVVYDAVSLMGDIDSQKEAIEGFFGSLKETKQAIKKHIAGQKKAEAKVAKAQAKKEAKAGQEKKPRGPRKKKAEADAEAEAVEGETQPTKKEKKAKKAKTEDDFVADMVSLATNAQLVAPAENVVVEIAETKEPAKRGRKPKAKAEAEPEPEVKAKKGKAEPKAKKEPKAAAPSPVPAADATADEGEELVVDTLEFNGKTYLVDDNNVVFDFESHEQVGKLVNNAVVLDA